jgi:hypothetical protein
MIEILGIAYMTDKEAARKYGYSTHWFQKQRSMKLPPPYVKLRGKGKVYYPVEELDRWFTENIFVYR